MGLLHSGSRALAYWSGIAGRGERRENAARILTFHGTPKEYSADLERQFRYLKRHFKIVSLPELVVRVQARSASIGGLLAVTFDDGLRNNVSVAYPILQRLGIPATFFVCPGLIERGRWLWNHQARQRLQFADAGLRRELGEQYDAPADVEGFIAWMKTLDLVSRHCVEKALREATPGYSPSAAERHQFDVARWDELWALDRSLVTIGSHGMTHAILPYLNAREVTFEVAESRRLIEARLGRPVELFAYPNGEHSPLVVECVRQHYAAAGADSAAWVRPASDPHVLPRITPRRGVLKLALSLHRRAAASHAWRPKPFAVGISS
ncbi:MAG TPA: polysaccharide deacetylase family protein [Burkholderiales bacterium]|nr:polysaccharide deacetylase family protein [Burkholderiales bacterium]